MTKVRPPVTIENTLYRVLGELGIENAAAATGRKDHYLRAVSDPDKVDQLTVVDLIKLDVAYRASGQPSLPLFETVGRILEAELAGRFADEAATGKLTADFAKEAGDATAAMILASQPGATCRELEAALREAEEADHAADAAVAHLRDRLRRARDGPPAAPG